MSPKVSYDPREHGALCHKCPLRKKRPVPPNGPKGARLAIVGEAPGYHEEEQGRGFVGPSGRELDKLLDRHGVDRDGVWISNALICRPKELRIGSDAKMDPKTLRAGMVCCRPRLVRELAELKRLRVVVALGATAIRSLSNRKSLSVLKARGFVWDPVEEWTTIKRRGRNRRVPAPYAVRKDVRIMPTVHPAFALRAPSWVPVMHADFERAVRALRGKLSIPAPKLKLAPKYDELDIVLGRLGSTVAVDVETTRLGATDCQLLCVGVSDGNLSVVVPWCSTKSIGKPWYGARQGSVASKINRALKGRTVVTHNGPGFDHIVLARYGIEVP